MKFVLDASVALSWLLEDAGKDQTYAESVFDILKRGDSEANVPAIWGLEIANVVAKSEARGLLTENRSQLFLSAVAAASIRCDKRTAELALSDTLSLCRRYQLSAYDASYLELALRLAQPLATLDQDLRRAALQAGVGLFAPS